MVQLAQEIATADGATLPFAEWWAQVSRCKSVGQWATKLQALGMPQTEIASASSFNKVGQKIYAHLLRDGSWADTDQQSIVLQ
eukprot:2119649-Pyramimonas_sp.AAC.1